MIVNSSIVAFNSKTCLDEDENIGFLPGNMNSKMETSVFVIPAAFRADIPTLVIFL